MPTPQVERSHRSNRDRSRISLELTPQRATWMLGLVKEQLDKADRLGNEFSEIFLIYKNLREKINPKIK